MTDSPKRLGAIVATALTTTSSGAEASGQLLYTVPGSTSTIVSTLFVCNGGTISSTFSIWHVQNGGVNDVTQIDRLYKDVVIQGSDTFATTSGISMEAGDSLVVYGASTNINFIAEGIEIT